MFFEVKPGTKPSVNDSVNYSNDRPLRENYSIPNSSDNRNQQPNSNNNNEKTK